MDELTVEHYYPDDIATGHTADENCACRPRVTDDGFGIRLVKHYDMSHRREDELEQALQQYNNIFLNICINSTQQSVIDLAKSGLASTSSIIEKQYSD